MPYIQSIFLFLSVLLASRAQAVQINYKISKVHGLYTFAETISGASHRSSTLKELFEKSPYNTEATKASIESFRIAFEMLEKGYNYKSLVDRPQGFYAADFADVQSILATSLADFSERMLDILPLPMHGQLISSLKSLEPVYDSFMGPTALSKLQRARQEIEDIANKVNMREMFRRTLIFYGASWPEEQNFSIGFYPIPAAKGNSSAESFGAVESMGILLDAKDSAGQWGVLFHELCHSIYGSQNIAFQEKLKSWFLANSSPYGRSAYRDLNEALATALGNGWAASQATGQLDPGEWYADNYINGFSKGLYPLVKNYVSNEKTIDEDFVKKAIAIFAQTFPDAPYEWDGFFKNYLALTEDGPLSVSSVRKAIGAFFYFQNTSGSSPLNQPETLESVHEKNLANLVVVVTDKEMKKLKQFAQKIPFLKSHFHGFEKRSTPSAWAAVDDQGRGYLILIVKNDADLRPAFEHLKKSPQKIDNARPWLKI